MVNIRLNDDEVVELAKRLPPGWTLTEFFRTRALSAPVLPFIEQRPRAS